MNGTPSHAFTIDVDGAPLVSQVFGYETSGAASFHVGSSPFTLGRIT